MTDEPLGCDVALEILSAALDGEATGLERRRLDDHLGTCGDCELVAVGFEQLDRRFRVRSFEPMPDLREAILSRSRPAVLGRNGWMRPGLAWVALVLVAQNVTALFAGRLAGADVHLARHIGAFGVALGVGMLFVAWRPHRAYGLLPFAGALSVTMVASAGFDIIDNGRTGVAELSHVTELVGLVLIWMIAGSPGRPMRRVIQRRAQGELAARAA